MSLEEELIKVREEIKTLRTNRELVIMKELDEIREQLKELRLKRDRLEREIYSPSLRVHRNGADSEYFLATDLVVYIDKYMKENEGLTLQALAERANISYGTVRNIRHGHSEFITFVTADRLFTAMGIPKVLDALPKVGPWKRNAKSSRLPLPPETQYFEE